MPLAEPTRVLIPKIGVDAPLVPLGLAADGSINVPDLNHVDEVSWYCQKHAMVDGKPHCSGGVIPGQIGPSALFAHINGHGRPGAFVKLPSLTVGDTVTIQRGNATPLTFRVYKYIQPHKANFDTAAVYGDVSRAEIRLITCTGAFIGGKYGYQDQGVVFASLVT